jgi:UDP-N-acetylmuramoyl-tripeptide--D-alanyl-D-alanine ligase
LDGREVLTAVDIAHHAHGVVAAGSPDAAVTSWAFDSRALERGACFAALRGERDGHDFVPAAFAAGASVALVSQTRGVEPPTGAAIVRVDDVLRRLQDLARTARAARPELRVAGVSGSTGKTSTKDLLAALLAPLGCYANPESYNNEFGLPITMLNAPASARVVVAEMGERFPGDVALLCDIAQPDVGIVTNVGLAHAEHLGGVRGAARAMSELLQALPVGGVAVLNADDPSTPSLRVASGVQVVTAGAAEQANYRVVDLQLDEQLRPSFSLRGKRFVVPLRGEHQVSNAALALAAAHRAFDIDLDAAADALAAVKPARWRLEVGTTRAGVTVLNDAYNANPDSVDAALRALARTPAERRVAVLGDMRELGEYGPDAHAEVGRRLGELHIDVLVGVGSGGEAIALAAAPAVKVYPAANAADAARVVCALVAPGDAVLVKASRAVGLERVAARLLGDGPARRPWVASRSCSRRSSAT